MASTIQSGRRRKVELTVLVDKSGSDTSQVVSVGATANVYLQGATVRSATGSPAVGAGQTIPISDPGMIEVGDVLQNGTASSPTFTVSAVNRVQSGNKLTWTLTGTASASFAFAADDRLINTSRRPTIYKDPGDDISWGGSSTTSTAAGMVRFYTKARAVDVIVSGGTPSVTATVVRDVPCQDEGLVVNVQDFGGSIKEALAFLATQPDAEDGGIVHVPKGAYIYDAADMDIDVPSGITIRGDGRGQTRILIESTSGNEDINLFNVIGSYVLIEEMELIGPCKTAPGQGLPAGSGVGIAVGYFNSSVTIQNVTLQNLNIYDFPSYAVEVGRRADESLYGIDHFQMNMCRLGGSDSGAQLKVGIGSTMIRITNCNIGNGGSQNSSPAGVYGIHHMANANATYENCDGNPVDLDTYYFFGEPANSYTDPKDGGCNLLIDNCDWEGQGVMGALTGKSTPLVYIQGWNSVTIRNTLFHYFGSGVHFEDCYAPTTDHLVLNDMGSAGYHVKITDTFNYQDRSSVLEYPDAAPDDGKRAPITVTVAGANPGWSMLGAGFKVPQYADDTERDTAPAAGIDDKRAMTVAGTLIYVVTPTSPTSHLQIRHGGAWVGVGEQDGTAI